MSPVRETHQSLGKVTYMRFKTSSYCLGGFGSGHQGIKEDRSRYLVATRGVLIHYDSRINVSAVFIMSL